MPLTGFGKKGGRDTLAGPEIAHVEIPYAPPREYNLRVVFTPIPLLDGIGLICAAGGRQFAGIVGNYGNTNCGFELYNGNLSNQNAAAEAQIRRWLRLVNRRVVVIAQVRNDATTLYLDGESVSVARGPYSRLDLLGNHKLRHDDAVGIVTSGLARIDEIEILEVTGTGKRFAADDKKPVAAKAASGPTDGPAKKYEPPRNARRVDLLALVDLKQDAVQGIWSREETAMAIRDTFSHFNSRIELCYAPPEEYDFCAEFVPLVEGKDVGLICRAGETQFAALVGAFNNKVCGFELFGGKLANVDTTATRRESGWLTKDRRHELVVQVRKAGTAIILDGAVVCPATVGYSQLSPEPSYRLKTDNTLGILSASTVRFEKVEIFRSPAPARSCATADSKPVAAETTRPGDLPVAMQRFPTAQVVDGVWKADGNEIVQTMSDGRFSVLLFGDPDSRTTITRSKARPLKGNTA